jgi:hypothetical protein
VVLFFFQNEYKRERIAMKSYIFRILIALDQLGNTIMNGDPDETISSRLAKLNRKGNKVGVIGCKILDKFQEGHCEKSIELDEGEKM